MGSPISIYLDEETLARLDAEVIALGKLDRSAGKTGHAITSRSSLIQQIIRDHLAGDAALRPTVEDIAYAVVPIAQAHGVRKVSLFGSQARGDATAQSDIDILVEKGAMHGLEVLDFQEELQQNLGRKVDVVTTAGASARFLEKIHDDAVVLYEAS